MFTPRFLLATAAAFALATTARAASLSLSGDARIGSNMFSNLDLQGGTLQNAGNTSSYLEGRFRINPDIVIDDRFSIKSTITLMQAAPDSPNDVPQSMGQPLDGSATQPGGNTYLRVNNAYLNWASDWGIFKFGRQPKSWGLGAKFNTGGDDGLADFTSSVDRAGFLALLGNLALNFGYEKGQERLLNNDADDIDIFEIALDYSNPESLFDVGLMYTRNVRTAGSSSPLKSSHDLSIFAKKRIGQLQGGAELNSMSQDSRSNAIGFLAQLDFMPGAFKVSADFAYASAASDSAFTFSPNYQPLLILFRQSVGPGNASTSVRGGSSGRGVGTALGSGDGAGAVLATLGVGYGFSKDKYILGADLGWASLARQGSNAGKNLGVELDLRFSQAWYDNFRMHYGFGMLFPGQAFGTDPQVGWGLQVRGVLKF
jgi:hypothetical protein